MLLEQFVGQRINVVDRRSPGNVVRGVRLAVGSVVVGCPRYVVGRVLARDVSGLGCGTARQRPDLHHL